VVGTVTVHKTSRNTIQVQSQKLTKSSRGLAFTGKNPLNNFMYLHSERRTRGIKYKVMQKFGLVDILPTMLSGDTDPDAITQDYCILFRMEELCDTITEM
jgi:hypothetical protein